MHGPGIRRVFAALVVGLAVTAAGPAAAKQCKDYAVIGDAMKATSVAILREGDAKMAARQNWIKNCMSRAGNPWCDHKISENREYSCNRVPSGLGTYNWTCTYTSKPCRN